MTPGGGTFFIRELAREIDEQLNGVRRELINLESLGILSSYEENKKKVYRLNKNCPFHRELSDIFVKNYDVIGKLETFFKSKRTLDLIALSDRLETTIQNEGTPATTVDVFLIGDLDRAEFNAFLEKTLFGRRVKYAVMSKDDFLYRLEYSDKLVLSILSQKGMKILKDRLDITEIIERKLREQDMLGRKYSTARGKI